MESRVISQNNQNADIIEADHQEPQEFLRGPNSSNITEESKIEEEAKVTTPHPFLLDSRMTDDS